MTKKYKKPDLVINMFDNNDIVLTGSTGPSVDDVKNIVTGDDSSLKLDNKSGNDLSNVISLRW